MTTPLKSAFKVAFIAAGVSIAALLFLAVAMGPMLAALTIDRTSWGLAAFTGGLVWMIAVVCGVSYYIAEHPTLGQYLPPLGPHIPPPPEFPRPPE